jgi:flagellar protein FlgJ
MQITSLPKNIAAADIAPERLANNSALTEQQKIAEASRQFEAILLRQILAATQKPVIPSKFADNSTAAQIYRDMVTDQLADSVSKSGAFGLAKTFEQQLTRADAPNSKQHSAGPEKTDSTSDTTTGFHHSLNGHEASPPRPGVQFPIIQQTRQYPHE